MAYIPDHLSVQTYGNGFTLWHYRSHDPAEAILAPNYFSINRDRLKTGDMMLIVAADRGLQVMVVVADQNVSLLVMSATSASGFRL